MGIPIVVVGKKHICPMSDGSKPHIGGTVTDGIDGILIDGIPVAVKGSKCVCDGSPKANSITIGSPGVFVDGEPIAIVGSMTEHGGVVIEGVPGVTISGGLQTTVNNLGKPEPRIFNLQWRKSENIVRYGEVKDKVILSADTIGYDDGEEVSIKVYKDGNTEPIDEITGTVNDGRVEVEWEVKEEEIK